MRAASNMPSRRRIEARLWTGTAGHLLGGTLDFAAALTRYFIARMRGRDIR